MNKINYRFDMKTPFDDLKYIFVSPNGLQHEGTFESAIPIERREFSGDIYEVRFSIKAQEKTLMLNKVIIYNGDDPVLTKQFSTVAIGRGFTKSRPPYKKVPGETLTIQWHLQYVEDSNEIVFIQPI